ncbi:hypothetical protein RchiOBHm_Chr6g0272571 [Rosa chinensis]|uniref:Uncharacterized protein n=1 Tax=Rosa chinensis TaxID=74649 RepID=A0A2P6PR87_ROSCH|nr:hypothetical protein RchiOBHm_Chr6g0272571 [Rosa chinensis]
MPCFILSKSQHTTSLSLSHVLPGKLKRGAIFQFPIPNDISIAYPETQTLNLCSALFEISNTQKPKSNLNSYFFFSLFHNSPKF